MRYREALEYLYSLRLFGTKLGLDNIREVLRRLDHPEANIDFYHVAGTNGKGSTCAFLNSLLGLTRTRVGCFTSPHLEDFRERIRVDGKAIGKKEVCRLLERLAPVLEGVARAPGCAHPTYFEAVTALALCYFRERGVEAAVWEVGMGGRLDATNAVVPKVAVVTTVAMDHSAYLGNDLESIAAEKAGIVKSGVPTVTGDLPPEAQGVVKNACRIRGARLLRASSLFSRTEPEVAGSRSVFTVGFPDGLGVKLALRLLGRHQADNCLTALAAWWTGEAGAAGRLDRGRVARALEETFWPGRFEIMRRGGIEFIVDGAHNPAGARALADVLGRYLRGRPYSLILGVLADKDVDGIVRELVPGARVVRTVTVAGSRALPGEELAARCRAAGDDGRIISCETLERAIGDCYSGAEPVSTVVVAGSLRLAGAARGMIGSRDRRTRRG